MADHRETALEKALTDAFLVEFENKQDAMTVNAVRKRAAKSLKIDVTFFKEDNWNARSREFVTSLLVCVTEILMVVVLIMP